MADSDISVENTARWPVRTDEQRDERLIGQVFGNIRIEHPEITREQVAERLRARHKAEDATKK